MTTQPLFDDLRLPDVKNIASTLSRMSNGKELVDLAKRSGLWTDSLHSAQWVRPEFSKNLGNLSPLDLTNSFALWTSEYGRLCELMGHLSAHRESAKLTGKAVRAGARARLRRATQVEGARAASASAISDEAEEDAGVISADLMLNTVEMIIAIVGATKEATATYLQTISREIAYRETQAKMRF